MKIFSNRNRPVHLGPFPLERLPRIERARPAPVSDRPPPPDREADAPFGRILREYADVLAPLMDGPVSPARAPGTDDPARLTAEVKAACYYLDAAMVGVCAIEGAPGPGRYAVVVLCEPGRRPEPWNPAAGWLAGTARAAASLRGAEIAGVVAGYLRQLGFAAHAHHEPSRIDLACLAEHAGLAVRRDGRLVAPFLDSGFACAAIVTDAPLEADRPLAPDAGRPGVVERLRFWLGVGGTTSGLQRSAERRRPTHLGRHPMEMLRTRREPTTRIVESEVPRVPKRAGFFERAAHGDLGERAKRERARFATKHPLAFAMTPLMQALVPLQDGPAASGREALDPSPAARAVKSLAYHLGADMVGICEAKTYAWYSHDEHGAPITPDHRTAIVILIDQGHETMEGASGDDWISGAQSMRAYLRGAIVSCLVAARLRALGHSARAHTNRASDVLHIPLILQAGLGELSRIGELVLNPFVGPRFKSAVVTTDMPLALDRPIDFGLQDTCRTCYKCARECPCSAISFGDKAPFNGYDMWKPDVERCTRYRVTNPKGSACGRCMKTCPYTNEGLVGHRAVLWASMWFPLVRRLIPWLDDAWRNGSRNPVKKWWSDLERAPDGGVRLAAGVNARDLNVAKGTRRKERHEVAYYPAAASPPADHAGPWPVNRAAALEAGRRARRESSRDSR